MSNRQSTFGKGASAAGSTVVASRTVVVPTSVVTLPTTKYAQAGAKRRKGRKRG